MLNAQEVIERLQLVPLSIEGGYFRETYRSALVVPASALPSEYRGERSASTAIYYLLTPDTFSEIHRLPTDEVFHFYLGDSVEMLQLGPQGQGRVIRIGRELNSDEHPQVVVPGGVWQGARLVAGGSYALLGCTVAPGFDYADYSQGQRIELVQDFPEFAEMIAALTRN